MTGQIETIAGMVGKTIESAKLFHWDEFLAVRFTDGSFAIVRAGDEQIVPYQADELSASGMRQSGIFTDEEIDAAERAEAERAERDLLDARRRVEERDRAHYEELRKKYEGASS